MPGYVPTNLKTSHKVLSKMHFQIPYNWNYMMLKRQLQENCAVVLRKNAEIDIIERRKYFHMPVLEEMFNTNETNNKHDSWSNEVSDPVLENRWSESNEKLKFWVENFDKMTQLLIYCLIVGEYDQFVEIIETSKDDIHWNNIKHCLPIFVQLPVSDIVMCLDKVVRKALKVDGMPLGKTLIVNSLVLTACDVDEKQQLLCEMISFSRKASINLVDNIKVKLVNTLVGRTAVCLLCIDLMIACDMLEEAVKALSTSHRVRLLLEGRNMTESHREMHGQILVRLFSKLYEKRMQAFAGKLALVNLTAKVLPIGVTEWACFAVGTLLEEDNTRFGDLESILDALAFRGLNLPETLERACMVKLSVFQESLLHWFSTFETYATFRRTLLAKKHTEKKWILEMKLDWTQDEMLCALQWVLKTHSETMQPIDENLIIFLKPNEEPRNVNELPTVSKILVNPEPGPLLRLSHVLRMLGLYNVEMSSPNVVTVNLSFFPDELSSASSIISNGS